jgi:hypothetical protein
MLMGVERLGAVTSEMLKHGVRGDLPVALVRWATTGQQETLTGTLSDIAQKVAAKNFEAPAVAVFGDVVSLRDTLSWYEKRPLLGKRIVVTRTRKQASALSNKLRGPGRARHRTAHDPDRAAEQFARVRGARAGRARVRLDCIHKRERRRSVLRYFLQALR